MAEPGWKYLVISRHSDARQFSQLSASHLFRYGNAKPA